MSPTRVLTSALYLLVLLLNYTASLHPVSVVLMQIKIRLRPFFGFCLLCTLFEQTSFQRLTAAATTQSFCLNVSQGVALNDGQGERTCKNTVHFKTTNSSELHSTLQLSQSYTGLDWLIIRGDNHSYKWFQYLQNRCTCTIRKKEIGASLQFSNSKRRQSAAERARF